jgi:hypothetical protein
MDNAGEQSDVNKLFQSMLLNLVGGACRPIYSDPTREVSKHLAESAVKALELGGRFSCSICVIAVFSRNVPNSAAAVCCCWILVLQIPELSPKMAVCKRSPVRGL